MTCNECDCADPTAIEGLVADCPCACHMTSANNAFNEATLRLVEWHSDAGHAWLRVPVELVKPIEDKVSGCSYTDSEFVYLEEDCDAMPFVEHYREALVTLFGSMPAVYGSTRYPNIKYVNDGDYSPIRRKPCYVPTENYRSPFSS